jgi:indolepyruvate ferredoxin oxidoreductase
MVEQAVSLEDKFTRSEGRVFLTGLQALVRLPMAQIRRDRRQGLKTAGFISGYRGSPLGGYDQQLQKAKQHLAAHDIVFRPAVNEDLAATAVWGSQQLQLSPGARYDGVVGIWYGKGPGVDRSGDVLKHGNAAGSAQHGGVLCLAGDDHGAKSSSIPHQSDHAFMSALMPMLYPSSIHEFIGMGLLGIAMSRYSGCWVGMKLISDTVETTAAIDLEDEAGEFVIPADFEVPPDGLNLRWPDDRWSQDHRLQNYKGYAAIAFGRANGVDRTVFDCASPRLGVVASGKAYEDVRQALRELEIDAEAAARIGLRVYKVGMPWPIEPVKLRHFCEGLEEVLIVEERREIIENQIKQYLFNWRADVRPRIIGKFDHQDRSVLPLDRELTVGLVAEVLAERIGRLEVEPAIAERIVDKLAYFKRRSAQIAAHVPPVSRLPYFCSGCPHNTSTRVPEGSRALAGIGCHFMAQWMDRRTETFTHMGAEGVPWVGMAPFTDERHIFANLGDGTYFHSGILAIRQAVAAGVNITYKILFNDAVAMTGGQPVDGELTVPQISHQLKQEGVSKVYLLSEQPEHYRGADVAPGTEVRHRDAIDVVMQELRATPGCTAIIYDQTCAAEKRRRRKRGLMEDPSTRVFINHLVCEGCGDCSVQSNCISIEPLETPLGRKRMINQSTCNKDYSCLKGFCPSFVTIQGAKLRRRLPAESGLDFEALPAPEVRVDRARPYNIAITGVGGTGVLTIGAILGMAAHLEGKASMILDMAGLAQKGGAVLSHVRLARHPDEVTTPRIVTGGADLLIAADSVVAASKDGIALCDPDRTMGVVNTHLTPVADFVRNRSFDFREAQVLAAVRGAVRAGADFEPFSEVAEAVTGDAIATNLMMLGFAWQRGLVPLAEAAILNAIELNGVAVEANRKAFSWGRMLAHNADAVRALIKDHDSAETEPETLEPLVAHRTDFLKGYQGVRLARRYRDLVERVRAASESVDPNGALALAVARYYFKLLSYKDEYEVARLYTDGEFQRRLGEQFEGDYKLAVHLAPPLLSGLDPNSGRPRKRRFGPWTFRAFGLLAWLRFLRGTPFDPFGYSEERRAERRLIREYEALIAAILQALDRDRLEAAIALASLPDEIRGFGPVKAAAIAQAQARKAALLERFRQGPAPATTTEAA